MNATVLGRDASAVSPFDKFAFTKLSFAAPPALPEPIVNEPTLVPFEKRRDKHVDPDEKGGNNRIKRVDTRRRATRPTSCIRYRDMKRKFNFPMPFAHKHPSIENVNTIVEAQMTSSGRVADAFALIMGSWKFIIVQTLILGAWAILNVVGWINHWDPYPFILLNLVLSLQAAYSAPIIMMSQNRTAERDRLEAHNDYILNVKSEEEVRLILRHLEEQNKVLEEIHDLLHQDNAVRKP